MAEAEAHQAAIDSYYLEERTFAPAEDFKRQALVTDTSLYDEAGRDWQGFWAKQALALDWFREWDTILDWHVAAGRGHKVAYHWEGEPGDTRTITYSELLSEVCRFANVLKGLGVRR